MSDSSPSAARVQPVRRRLAGLAATLLFALAPLCAGLGVARAQDYRRVEPLLDTARTILDEPIVYPGPGPARITSSIVTLQPGESTGWHRHGVPLYAYILAGAVTVDYGAHGTRVLTAGTAIMEAMAVRHEGRNEGDEPCRILVVFLGAEDAPPSVLR